MENCFFAYGAGTSGCDDHQHSFLDDALFFKAKELVYRGGYCFISSNFNDMYMAARMKVKNLTRRIHLVSSMIMFSFLFMYVVTGIIHMNRNLFKIPPVEETLYTLPVEKKMDGTAREYSKYLEEEFDLKGRTAFNQNRQENWVFHFNFPGNNVQITLTPVQDSLYFHQWKQEMTFFTVTNGMHVLRGFKGGWAYTAWAVMYDVSCVAMFVFALTGILLWYRSRKRFRYGWWFLAAGMLIPLVFIFLFVFWK